MTKAHLVIPSYNEAERLPPFLACLLKAIADAGLSVSVLVVDDGSLTQQRVLMHDKIEQLRADMPFLAPLLVLPQNRGKGGAIMEGWEQAPPDADWLLFVDADGAIAADEVVRLLRRCGGAGEDAWFASRVKMLGRRVERSWSRHLSGRGFATIVGWLLDPQVYDTQCGCKGVSRSSWMTIAPRVREVGFAFDVELLMALRGQGAVIVEVPVDWCDRKGSKVSLLRDGIRMLRAVLRIRRRFQCGALG